VPLGKTESERIRNTALLSRVVEMGVKKYENKQKIHFPFSRFVLSFLIFCHHVLQTARSEDEKGTRGQRETEKVRYTDNKRRTK